MKQYGVDEGRIKMRKTNNGLKITQRKEENFLGTKRLEEKRQREKGGSVCM